MGFPHEIRPKFHILNSTRQPDCIIIPSKGFCPWLPTSLLTTTLGYGCSWAILFWTRHALNPQNYSSEDSEANNRLQKCILLTLWRIPSKLQVLLLGVNVDLDGMTTWPDCQVKFQNGSIKSQILGSFPGKPLHDSRGFRGWNLGGWKNSMFTC